MKPAQYVGRFAPSPTGPLHFGSLLAAMSSYCDARSHNGLWFLRVDDIDPPRTVPGASEGIERTLKAYGFSWDGPVRKQSERSKHYLNKLTKLNELKMLFPCACSRSRLAKHSPYPGYCNPVSASSVSTTGDAAVKVRKKLKSGDKDHAIRIIIDTDVWFEDRIQGQQIFSDGQPGDTIVMRRDDLFAYTLACAVDDADGISHVVRGSDLLPTTAGQIAVIKHLGLEPPVYAHIPVAVNVEQQKLSKQTHAQALDTMQPLPTLLLAWQFLGQREINVATVDAFWQEAISLWELASVPRQSQLDTPA